MSFKNFLLFIFLFAFTANAMCGDFMTNIPGREKQSLNGKWDILIDYYDRGDYMKIYEYKQPENNTDLYEYSFDRSNRLNVPGDWNSQLPELKYYDGTVWYAKEFDMDKHDKKRQFLYFGAVNYHCVVYLNGEFIGEHEGGFTPFQFEVTNKLKKQGNILVLRVNNERRADAIPAMSYDWWNYGGITRDVDLIYTADTFIDDYFVRLNNDEKDRIDCWVQLNGNNVSGVNVTIELPELKIKKEVITNPEGRATVSFKATKLTRWSPENPHLYKLILTASSEKLEEMVGFRNVSVEGTKVLLNGKPIFFKGISFHEEIPQRMGRAVSKNDAYMLLFEAKALGSNMVRLAHNPQNEYIVRMAEEMGFMIWQEIPIWQKINFDNKKTCLKAEQMMMEMINRDKNRCAIITWGVANETWPSESRDNYIKHIVKTCREIDPTRLYTAAFDLPKFNEKNLTYEMNDDVTDCLDFVSVNKYIGWYETWKTDPANVKWNVNTDKPLVFSEFGGEALCGQQGDTTWVSSWTEGYQAQLYRDNLKMFENVPNLQGTFPWVLFDFRSPLRLHAKNQDGWNRKGLISDQGQRKKAWYVMREYYNKIKN